MADDSDLLVALTEIVGKQLGPQGSFPGIGRDRTEEILLLLLKRGSVVRAHDRVWSIPIPADMLDAVHRAGGKTRAEWDAERAASTGGA